MRVGSEHIWQTWTDGGLTGNNDFVGEAAPSTRLTVSPNWYLTAQSNNLGKFDKTKAPIRWWQDVARSVPEVEIPQESIRQVSIKQDLTQDAATLDVTLINSGMFNRAGYLYFTHGASSEAKSLWDQEENLWKGVIAPSAMIRVYTGFGGKDKSIADAVNDGNLVPYGVFMVDDIKGSSKLELSCRDMAALLIDQQIYPPLVPEGKYPLEYHRWNYTERTIKPAQPFPAIIDVPIKYWDSGSDAWNGAYGGAGPKSDSPVLGHFPSQSIDGNANTYALSVGNSYPTAPWAKDWWEYSVYNKVNSITVHAWAGPCTCWISILEGSSWVGDQTIPYDASVIVSTQDIGIDTGAAIPFVVSGEIGADQAFRFDLPRTFDATLIRVTLSAGTWVQQGPWHYRSGIRELKVRQVGVIPAPSWQAITAHPSGYGYWAMHAKGRVEYFGDARLYNSIWGVSRPLLSPWDSAVDIAATPTGEGYWVLTKDGNVQGFGDAKTAELDQNMHTFDGVYGSCAIVPTSDGAGFWVIDDRGDIHEFGTAMHFDGFVAHQGVMSADRTPTDDGLYIIEADGTLHTLGTAVDRGGPKYGNADFALTRAKAFSATEIHVTPSGLGYYIVDQRGIMYAQGDAVHLGNATNILPDGTTSQPYVTCMMVTPIEAGVATGYAMMDTMGHVYGFGNYALGDAHALGDPSGGQSTLRSNGNYCVDESTEIFTRRGWLAWDQVEVGDETLSIDPSTSKSEWSPISDMFISDPGQHDMVSIANTRFDALVTPNHKWLVKNSNGKLVWRTTLDIGKYHSFPLAATRTDMLEVPTYSDDFVELVAWFWTEGCDSGDRASLSQSEIANPEYVRRIDKCLTALYGAPGSMRGGSDFTEEFIARVIDHYSLSGNYSETGREFGIHNSTVKNWADSAPRPSTELPKWNKLHPMSNGVVQYKLSPLVRSEIVNVCPDKTPTVAFLNSLTSAQLDLFISTSVDADGNRRSDNGTTILGQNDKARIDALQYACSLAGIPTTVHERQVNSRPFWEITLLRRNFTGNTSMKTCRESYNGRVWCPTVGHHNWLARRNGKVYFTGNSDFVDIIKDLLLWSGFWLKETITTGGSPAVFGNIESTGTWSEDDLTPDFFDKQPPINPINKIKAIVAYCSFLDMDGAYHFESPNTWQSGNFWSDGTHTDTIPSITDDQNMTDWTPTYTRKYDRSVIIGTSDEPTDKLTGTITSRYVPPQDWIRGMVIPGMFGTPLSVNIKDQKLMTELTALQLWFRRHTGSVTFLANPCIGVNDQIRIFERVTSETYCHYIVGTEFTHDMDKGTYNMTATTYWLGTPDDWAISQDSITNGIDASRFSISQDLQDWLKSRTNTTQGTSSWNEDPPAPIIEPLDAPREVGAGWSP